MAPPTKPTAATKPISSSKPVSKPTGKPALPKTAASKAAAKPAASKAAAPAKAAAAAPSEARVLFDQYDADQDGALKLGEFANFIKAKQEEWAFERDDSLGMYIKRAFAEAGADAEKKVRFDGWSKWLPTFLAFHDGLKKAEEEKHAAKAAERAAEVAAEKAAWAPGGVWPCKLARLQAAIDATRSAGKTPLLIDRTTTDSGEVSPLETFYSYSGHSLVELKKMVVEVNVKKSKPLEEAREEVRRKLVLAMHRGYEAVLLCANSAPPLTSKFADADTLPLELLDAPTVAQVCGPDAPVDWKQGWAGRLPRPTDADKIHFVHKDFAVVVVTRFAPEDYAEFLGDELPLHLLQPIHVTVED